MMGENVLRHDPYSEWLWDWPFENKEILNDPKHIRPIDQQDIVNKLNQLHFTGDAFQIFFQDNRTQEKMLLQAKIKFCTETTVACSFSDKTDSAFNERNHQITHLAIDDGKNLTLMPTYMVSQEYKYFTIHLPDAGYEVNQRQIRRHLCRGAVHVALLQDAQISRGILLEFSSFDCRVRIESSTEFRFSKDSPISISFYHGRDLCHSCLCYSIRETVNPHRNDREIVLKFVQNSNPIAPNKRQFRNPRLRFNPTPSADFLHPILQKRFHFEIADISSAGFSVCENEEESVFIEGMAIPDLRIHFSDLFSLQCSAKIVYCRFENNHIIRCGFSITDMDMPNYNRLQKMLNHALDGNVYLNNRMDMDVLWDFFFRINFIYPKKYQHVKSIKNDIKKTYKLLYRGDKEVACHLTYQKNNFLCGHLSMVRAYEKTWLIHHHAAKVTDNKPIGFLLLKHGLHYFIDMHRLSSLNTDYFMCYFRPENKFPEKVFGGFCRNQADPEICSMDLWGYFEKLLPTIYSPLNTEWSLRPADIADLELLSDFYQKISGGLLLKAMDLDKTDLARQPLESLYEQSGLFRKLRKYSLCYNGEPHAIFILDLSNSGLNMSDLLNNIKVIILKTELPWKILSNVLFQLMTQYQTGQIPILIYPFDYIIMQEIPCKKQYAIWICKASHFYRLAVHMQERYRITYWN